MTPGTGKRGWATGTMIEEHWLPTSQGHLYAKSWCPAGRAFPSDPTILLLHDSLGCVELWRNFPERLASTLGLPVLAYDRLGFGRSDPHPGRLAPGFIRDEASMGIRPFCERLGITRLVPLGHSVGGAMAIAAAAQLPALCAAVVTLAAQVFVEEHTLAGIRDARLAFQDPGQIARLARYHGPKTPWVLGAWIETWLSPGFAGWTLDEELAQLRCPLLALHGDRDEYGTPRHPERMARSTPGPFRQAILRDCGHVPHREKPDEVLLLLSRFLAPPAFARPMES